MKLKNWLWSWGTIYARISIGAFKKWSSCKFTMDDRINQWRRFFNHYIIQIIWFLLFCLYIFRGMVYFIVIWTRQHGIFERIWSESYRGYKSSWWTIPYRHNLFKKPLNAKSKSKFVATLMCFLWELICVLFSYFFMSEFLWVKSNTNTQGRHRR